MRINSKGACIERSEESQPSQASIVANSIASAIEGHFGDHHATKRTRSSRLFINPLMYQYWGFQLESVIKRVLYFPDLLATRNFEDLRNLVAQYRTAIVHRPWENMPL